MCTGVAPAAAGASVGGAGRVGMTADEVALDVGGIDPAPVDGGRVFMLVARWATAAVQPESATSIASATVWRTT
jgi:hypothetical protein